MNDTSIPAVSASTSRNVTAIATAAISSGSNASSDPNASASTINAPPAPSAISTMIGRSEPPPLSVSGTTPVTTSGAPATRASASMPFSTGIAWAYGSGPAVSVGYTSANSVRPSADTNGSGSSTFSTDATR